MSSPYSNTSYDLASPNSLESASSFFEKEKKRDKTPYTWNELNYLEQRRRAILKRVELPFWRILLFWDGTCLRALLSDWLIWITLAIFVVIRYMAWKDLVPDFVNNLANSDIKVLGGFLSFFLVLFVNQSNTRFMGMYRTSMACQKFIFDISGVASTVFPRPHALRIVRYINASHAAGYTGLSNIYTKKSFFDGLNRRLQLLTEGEMQRVEVLNMDHGVDCSRELMMWCLQEVQNAQKKDIISSDTAIFLREKILGFQENMDSLYAYKDQPIHFYYIHFLCLLSALYLPLFAINNALAAGFGNDMRMSTDIIQGVIVLVQAIYVVGLRLLGQRMLDPYGDDLEDLSVLYYVWSTGVGSRRILEVEFPEELDPQLEKKLASSQVSLGAALSRKSDRPTRLV